jgi:hypothetical protein
VVRWTICTNQRWIILIFRHPLSGDLDSVAVEDASRDYNSDAEWHLILKLGLNHNSLVVTTGILVSFFSFAYWYAETQWVVPHDLGSCWKHHKWDTTGSKEHTISEDAWTTGTRVSQPLIGVALVVEGSFLGQSQAWAHGRPMSAPHTPIVSFQGDGVGGNYAWHPGKRAPSQVASNTTYVQRLDDSRDFAVRTKYRISLHSSSMRESR